jgi:N-acetylglutamate synthase-like GNAT family acetyltransferase
VDDFVIRVAVASEQKSLEELQWRASLGNPGDREALLAHPDAIELPLEQIAAGDVFVLESAGTIAGFAALRSRPNGDADLDALFVDPPMQRRGFGRRLVKHCAQAAHARGLRALYVVGNPHAEHFYLACGFLSVGTSQTRFGPALLMRRPLP